MSEKFLEAIKPEIAVISSGKDNSYGHPAKYSLEILQKQHSDLLRTDELGHIEVLSDGKMWSIKH
jgi:competence protein ComEC